MSKVTIPTDKIKEELVRNSKKTTNREIEEWFKEWIKTAGIFTMTDVYNSVPKRPQSAILHLLLSIYIRRGLVMKIKPKSIKISKVLKIKYSKPSELRQFLKRRKKYTRKKYKWIGN